MSSDGLADMAAARNASAAKRRNTGPSRQIPTPRHRAKTTPPEREASAVAKDAESEEPTPVPAPAPSTGSEDLHARTIHLDQAADDWLEDIAIVGRRSRPRVAVSRSAVVRYALERLRAEQGAEAVVAVLASRGTDQAGGGRKRR